MNNKAFLRITGLVGFVMAAVATYLYMAYILVPTIMPILTQQIESQLSSEGVAVNQSDISGFTSFMATIMPVTALWAW
ncbi:hypothetical protein [Vulcanisaeta sp. JCM 16159]|uniref:hypothetical protein n=1 Tax=Vulcanisaeta sp. JCM 16159 TaxID=1295371 RepID=UPI000A67E795|nr:hypothetical protein [Vulcanisaeta sp. JCM 16159]